MGIAINLALTVLRPPFRLPVSPRTIDFLPIVCFCLLSAKPHLLWISCLCGEVWLIRRRGVSIGCKSHSAHLFDRSPCSSLYLTSVVWYFVYCFTMCSVLPSHYRYCGYTIPLWLLVVLLLQTLLVRVASKITTALTTNNGGSESFAGRALAPGERSLGVSSLFYCIVPLSCWQVGHSCRQFLNGSYMGRCDCYNTPSR